MDYLLPDLTLGRVIKCEVKIGPHLEFKTND